MVIPPPNVTGSLHLGHALTNAIQVSFTLHACSLSNTLSVTHMCPFLDRLIHELISVCFWCQEAAIVQQCSSLPSSRDPWVESQAACVDLGRGRRP
jgi:hypothetical protein